jgi:phosphatidate cytidylyltransferase
MWFVALITVVVLLATWELAELVTHAGFPAMRIVAVLASIAGPLALATGRAEVAWLLVVTPTIGGLGSLAFGEFKPNRFTGWGLSLASGMYVGGLLSAGIPLRALEGGLDWVVAILAATWCCDTAAFFVGRRWGRHKLAPAVSPGKTVEGLIGGIVAAMVAAVAIGAMVAQPALRMVGFGAVVAVGSVIGDLAESAIKRQLGAKDSGQFMPGHGGMLDRIDSLLFAVPLGLAYIILTTPVTFVSYTNLSSVGVP